MKHFIDIFRSFCAQWSAVLHIQVLFSLQRCCYCDVLLKSEWKCFIMMFFVSFGVTSCLTIHFRKISQIFFIFFISHLLCLFSSFKATFNIPNFFLLLILCNFFLILSTVILYHPLAILEKNPPFHWKDYQGITTMYTLSAATS